MVCVQELIKFRSLKSDEGVFMVNGPDSNFIMQKLASLSSGDGYGFYEQRVSSA
jgi:hypothetical protein